MLKRPKDIPFDHAVQHIADTLMEPQNALVVARKLDECEPIIKSLVEWSNTHHKEPDLRCYQKFRRQWIGTGIANFTSEQASNGKVGYRYGLIVIDKRIIDDYFNWLETAKPKEKLPEEYEKVTRLLRFDLLPTLAHGNGLIVSTLL